MKFETSRFGTVEVEEDKVLHFEYGLPGFPSCNKFVVMDHDLQTPLKWLQCVDRPEVAFLVVEPEQVVGSYEVDVPDSMLRLLGLEEGAKASDVAVFVILNTADEKLTANLRAPVVVNVAQRRAVQLILDKQDVSLRHPIGAPDSSSP